MAEKIVSKAINPLWRGMLVFILLVSLPGSSSLRSEAAALEITLTVDTPIDSNDPGYQECSAAADDCSLRGAISRANLDIVNDYIVYLPAWVYYLTLAGVLEDENQSGDLDILGKVTLVGDNADYTILDANRIDRVLHVRPGARVELWDITIQGGKGATGIVAGVAGDYGGGILNQGNLVIRDSVIRNNQAGDGSPGALEIDGGKGGSGGGIYNLGVIEIVGSTIMNNLTGKGGDGWNVCHQENMFCTVCEQCTFPGDGGNGAGIFNGGMLNLESSMIVNNSIGQPGEPALCSVWYYTWCSGGDYWKTGLNGAGGGVYNQGRVQLEYTEIGENEGGTGAGGLDNYGAAYLTGGTLSGNRGDTAGGISNQVEAVLTGCTVGDNSGGNGGGVYNRSDLLLKESWIRDNDAALGGGIYNDGTMTVVDTKIANNYTREGEAGTDGYFNGRVCFYSRPGETAPGGGVYNAGKMTVDHSQIRYNSTGAGGRGGNGFDDGMCGSVPGADGGAGGYGGGIYNSGILELNLSTVEKNTTGNGGMGGESEYENGEDGAGGAGGGLYNSGTAWMHLSTFDGNRTGEGLHGGAGGAIANKGELVITGGSLRDNQAVQDGYGGGLYSSSPFSINAVTAINNAAGGAGGGFSFGGTTGEVANSILGHNCSAISGGGLYSSGSMINLNNTTFAQNCCGDGSGLYAISSTLHLTNTILVNHTIGVITDENSLVDMESTLWGSGVWANQLDWSGSGTIITGTHNYREEPGFLDPGVYNYHITSESAAIDRGVSNGLDADVHFQPRPNPQSGQFDLGADEYWESIPLETVSLSGPSTVTPTTVITLTATSSPENATPNILYYWLPAPVEGQWTESALYAWKRSGTETVTLMAINAASTISETMTIIVEPVYTTIYLPSIGR